MEQYRLSVANVFHNEGTLRSVLIFTLVTALLQVSRLSRTPRRQFGPKAGTPCSGPEGIEMVDGSKTSSQDRLFQINRRSSSPSLHTALLLLEQRRNLSSSKFILAAPCAGNLTLLPVFYNDKLSHRQRLLDSGRLSHTLPLVPDLSPTARSLIYTSRIHTDSFRNLSSNVSLVPRVNTQRAPLNTIVER